MMHATLPAPQASQPIRRLRLRQYGMAETGCAEP